MPIPVPHVAASAAAATATAAVSSTAAGQPLRWLGLVGRAGSGKDWLCDELAKTFYVNRVAISQAIKTMLLAANPLVDGTKRLQDAVAENGMTLEKAKWAYPEIRRLMQTLGTEGGRSALGENVWIDAALRRGKPGHLNIITDVRFANEAAAVRAVGGIIVRVNRSNQPTDLFLSEDQAAHASETSSDTIVADYVFVNRGDSNVREIELLIDRLAHWSPPPYALS